MAKHILTNAFDLALSGEPWTGLWAHSNAQGGHCEEPSFRAELTRTAKRGLIDYRRAAGDMITAGPAQFELTSA